MCLTIPKKVIEIKEDAAIVEMPNGDRQEVRTIVTLKPGDFCLTQQNIAIEYVDPDEANELLTEIKKIKEKGDL